MQREHVSVPKIICYLLLMLIYYGLQTSLLRGFSIRGFHLDLLPCFVAVAALHDGPIEGLIMGMAVGIFYDLGLSGLDGLYPLLYMLFGCVSSYVGQRILSKNYVSTLILTAVEMLLIGLARYFAFLLPSSDASFLLVMQQLLGDIVICLVFCFLVYTPMRALGKRFGDT